MKKAITFTLVLLIALSSIACGAAPADRPPIEAESKTGSTSTPAPAPTPVPEDGIESDGLLHVYLIGDGEDVTVTNSSFIDYLTYYADCGHLIISMNGKEYVFANVSASTWKDFKAADSKGEYYNSVFKGNTKYHVNDYDGTNGGLIVLEYVG